MVKQFSEKVTLHTRFVSHENVFAKTPTAFIILRSSFFDQVQ